MSANKQIIGKGRVKKEETLEKINSLGITTDSHDAADAAKFLLHHLKNNGIDYQAS